VQIIGINKGIIEARRARGKSGWPAAGMDERDKEREREREKEREREREREREVRAGTTP
jgi:hypothetical protein